MKLKVTGARRQSGEIVTAIFEAIDDEDALMQFHAAFGPAPEPYTELMGDDWAEAFAVDYA